MLLLVVLYAILSEYLALPRTAISHALCASYGSDLPVLHKQRPFHSTLCVGLALQARTVT